MSALRLCLKQRLKNIEMARDPIANRSHFGESCAKGGGCVFFKSSPIPKAKKTR
jgi:hypothetical protein